MKYIKKEPQAEIEICRYLLDKGNDMKLKCPVTAVDYAIVKNQSKEVFEFLATYLIKARSKCNYFALEKSILLKCNMKVIKCIEKN